MNVSINNTQQHQPDLDLTQLEQVALKILAELQCPDSSELSLSLVDDQEMHKLNLYYRGIDRSTDVLSFALQEAEEPPILHTQELPNSCPVMLGDVILSVDTIQRQAQEFGYSYEEELYFLLIHGILHLVGYDHHSDEETRQMKRAERRLLNVLHIHRHEQ